MTITPIPSRINVCIQPIRNIKPITVMSRFCPFAHLGWMLRKSFIVLFSGRAVILWFIPETLKAEAVECIRLRAFWLIHKVALINELLHQPHSPQPYLSSHWQGQIDHWCCCCWVYGLWSYCCLTLSTSLTHFCFLSFPIVRSNMGTQ